MPSSRETDGRYGLAAVIIYSARLGEKHTTNLRMVSQVQQLLSAPGLAALMQQTQQQQQQQQQASLNPPPSAQQAAGQAAVSTPTTAQTANAAAAWANQAPSSEGGGGSGDGEVGVRTGRPGADSCAQLQSLSVSEQVSCDCCCASNALLPAASFASDHKCSHE